jgi:uncharacterized RDD family membrane protein YckC
MSERLFDPESFAVAQELVGRKLPSPWRRLLAFALDFLLLILPTLGTAALCAALALRLSDPTGYRALKVAVLAMPEEPAARKAVMRDLAPLLARIDADGLPAAVKAYVEAGELDRAADRLAAMELLVALDLGDGNAVPIRANTVRLRVERLIPDVLRSAAVFFVPAIYFAVATARWGATVGKRLLGLRVARLDGRALSLFDSIERFGAYFGLFGTLGLGLFELWRDPNRRLGHDRAADTVVIRDARRGGRQAGLNLPAHDRLPRLRGAALGCDGPRRPGIAHLCSEVGTLRRFIRSCMVFAALALAALALAGCRKAVAPLHGARPGAAPDLFDSDLVARTVRDVEARVGAPLSVLDLQVENGSIRLQVQDPKRPENVDQFEWRQGVLDGPRPVQLLGSGNLAASLYPISAVDLAQIPAFTQAALAKLGIEEARPTSLRIRMEDPPRAIQRRLRGERVAAQILVRFYADSTRKKGMVDADSHFAILKATVF